MGAFLKENWLWIVAPMVLVLIAVVVILLSGGASDGAEGEAKYIYNLW